MVKLVYCVRKKDGISDEEFREYWLRKHGPFVKSYAETLRADRYVQSHTLDTVVNGIIREERNSAEPYDGITEIWWDSMETVLEVVQSPEYQEVCVALANDENVFVDIQRSSLFFTEEHTIF